MNLQDKKIAIIGLGYVGLPLAVEFGKKYKTVGFDINEKRIEELKLGIDKTCESNKDEIGLAKQLRFSSLINDIKDCTVFIVTVPTPINQFKAPDLGPLLGASIMIGKNLKKGDLVIYESTVYPGCTEEDCVPVLEKESGLIFNKDFYCGYSPERINPGDKVNTLTKIKKVTSGSTPEIAEMVDQLYKSIISAGTHKAPTIKVAEASKAIENAQRDVNISFVNELALIFDRMKIDTTEVLEAAGTKFNFLAFKPGLVGGHCISVDPYYLTSKAETLGYYSNVINSGRRVNDDMGKFIANKVVKLMIQKNFPINQSRVLVMGITFKENCPDIRNSKVIDVINELKQFGVDVTSFDPKADSAEVMHEYQIEIEADFGKIKDQKFDAIIHAVSHKEFQQIDIKSMLVPNGVLYDVKSVLPKEMVDGRL